MTPTTLSPHIRAALDRIATGWRVAYVGYGWPWHIYNVGTNAVYFCATQTAAIAEYLRLTARNNEGKGNG